MWLYLFIVIACLFLYSWKRLCYFSSCGVRTLPPLPFLGNLAAVTAARENFVDVIDAGYKKFKDQRYFGVYQYHVPTVVPKDPELLRQILVRDFHAFTDRGIHIEPDCDKLFGLNLINLTGSKWRSMRVALTPAFSGARFRSMAPLMAECSKTAVRFLMKTVGDGKEIETDSIVSPYVNDVIASCAFGFAVDSLEDPGNALFRLGQTALIQNTTQIMKFFGYANFPTFMKLIGVKIISAPDAEKFAQLFNSALKSRREKVTPPRPDFIQTLIDAAQGKLKHETETSEENKNEDLTNWGKKFTDDDLVAQAVLFYIAGYDTTANFINFFLHEMATNPDIQDKVLEEIDQLDEDADVYEAIQKLEYLDMCVCETLRLWPLVGSADRRSVSTYDFGPTCKGSNDRLIAEPGIHIWLPIFSIQRDEQYWPRPNVFDPERFTPARKSKIVPYTYMPFGNGPRHCIGSRFALLASKMFIVTLLRGSRVRAGPHTPAPLRLAPLAFVLRPTTPFAVIVEPRERDV